MKNKKGRPRWALWYWDEKFIDYVRKSSRAKCQICKKRLGVKDRDEHSGNEHSRCHAIVSESCLG